MESKVVLVSGASRGIGRAVAKELSARGARVFLGSREASRASAAAEDLGCEWIQLDVLDSSSVEKAAEDIAEKAGHLDVLINNGAILLDHYAPLRDLDPAVLMDTFATNVAGVHRLTLAMLPLLVKSRDPRIVNVSSGAGQLDGDPQPWAPAYSISKTALNMLTQQMTAAFPGFAVNSVCPGWCRTDMGGEEAPRTAEEGADSIVWLAMEAPSQLWGKFIRDRQEIPW